MTPTWAQDQPEPDAIHDDSGRPDIELGARVFSGYGPPKDIEGVVGLRLDGVWMRAPHYGFGAAAALLKGTLVGEYFQDGVFNIGYHGLVFAEGDLLEGWISPYARLGLGLGNYERYTADQRATTKLNAVAELEAGVALRLGHLVVRLSAAPSFYGKDFWVVVGGQVGARF